MRRIHRFGLAGLLFLAGVTGGAVIHGGERMALFHGTTPSLADNYPPVPTVPTPAP